MRWPAASRETHYSGEPASPLSRHSNRAQCRFAHQGLVVRFIASRSPSFMPRSLRSVTCIPLEGYQESVLAPRYLARCIDVHVPHITSGLVRLA